MKDKMQCPKDKLVEIDGVSYQLIESKLYRYADLTLDKGFKIVLGKHGSEEVLKNLLNCLLGTEIIDLEYCLNEYPGMTEDDRASRFDVFCREKNGRGFLIEMQNWSQKYFNKRAVYYSSLAIQNQATEEYRRQKEEGKKWNYDFKPLYVVSFLNCKNWTFEGSSFRLNEHIATYRYRDIENGIELGDGTTLVFIDLKGFRKTIDDCHSREELWIYSIKNMAKQNECPAKVAGTEVEPLYDMAELAKMTHEERIAYQMSMIHRNDYLNSLQEAVEDATKEGREIGFKKGLEEGIEQGREEGRMEGRMEGLKQAMKQMAESGISVQDIATIMKMTEKEINKIID